MHPQQLMTFGMTWTILPMIVMVIVHLAFSVAVMSDASSIRRERRTLVFVGPWIWCLAVLVGGVFVALAYWAMHHSTLSKP